jgi:large subunit ribosomal protein L29
MNWEQLEEQLDLAYQELFNLRFQLASRQLQDTNALTRAKRELARVRTIMRERELLEEYYDEG